MKIRHKITMWVAAAGLLTSLVFSAVVFLEMREQPFDVLDGQLENTASAVVGHLENWRPSPAPLPTALTLISSQLYWVRVYDQDLSVMYQSDLAKLVDLPLYRDRGDDGYTISSTIDQTRIHLNQDDTDEVTFRVRVIRKKIAQKPCLVQIARPIESLEEEINELLTALGFGLAASTLLLVFISYGLAGRMVKPIARINRNVRRINETTLTRRIPLPKNQDELYELTDRLNQMFDRLQCSFARQKQFLADASHELKSPIANLRLFFEEIDQMKNLPESLHRRLSAQLKSVLRMDRLVKALLELSILEIRASLASGPLNLSEMVMSVVADFSPLVEKNGILLKTEVPDNIEIQGDRDKIRRVLINLLDNAIKYNVPEGRIRIGLAESDNRVTLTICNTGTGIPARDLHKVFDQFYRVEKSRSTRHGGAGLGLSIVRRIIRLHHGKITIDSEPGRNIRVTIVLPSHQPDDSVG